MTNKNRWPGKRNCDGPGLWVGDTFVPGVNTARRPRRVLDDWGSKQTSLWIDDDLLHALRTHAAYLGDGMSTAVRNLIRDAGREVDADLGCHPPDVFYENTLSFRLTQEASEQLEDMRDYNAEQTACCPSRSKMIRAALRSQLLPPSK